MLSQHKTEHWKLGNVKLQYICGLHTHRLPTFIFGNWVVKLPPTAQPPSTCTARLKIKESGYCRSAVSHPSATGKNVCATDSSRLALLDLSWWIIQLLRGGDVVTKRTLPENQTRLHQQNARAPSRPSPTSITISSSSFFSASFTSSPRCSNFIFTSAQDPVSERAGSGRADGGGQLGWVSLCPCWLWSLGPSISVRGKHLRNPLSFHPPHSLRRRCLRGTSVLNGAFTQYWLAPQVSPLGRVGSSLSYFFPLLPRLELGLSRWMEGWLQKLGEAVMKIKWGSVSWCDTVITLQQVKRALLHTLLSPCVSVSQLSRHWTSVTMSALQDFSKSTQTVDP